jgi:hypothetical protein
MLRKPLSLQRNPAALGQEPSASSRSSHRTGHKLRSGNAVDDFLGVLRELSVGLDSINNDSSRFFADVKSLVSIVSANLVGGTLGALHFAGTPLREVEMR